MAKPTDVVDRVDSLLRRRRSFVASAASHAPATDAAPATTDGAASAPVRAAPGQEAAAATTADDDDLPVLTEVLPAEAAVFQEHSDRFDDTQVSLLAADMAHAIGQQMSFELPSLLEAAMLLAGEELRAGMTSTMETALRDFIARRKQLRLPLDEPDQDD